MILTSVKFKGDKFIITHGEDVTETYERNYKRRKSGNNGFNKEHSWRMIGDIPLPIYNNFAKIHPEVRHGDRKQKDKALRKLLTLNPLVKTVHGGI